MSPRLQATAKQMKASNTTDRFIYTTHPWLMQRFLECPCPAQAPAPAAVGVPGVWTRRGPGGKARYLFSPTPGPAFALHCLTEDAQGTPGGKASGCAWDTGTCTLAGGSALSCRLDNGTTLTGALSEAKDAIAFGGGAEAWSKFTGRLSGLWYGPADVQDYYVVTEDAASGNVTVWWDTSVSKAGWAYSTAGSLQGTTLRLDLLGFGLLTGAVSADYSQIAWA